MKKDYTKLSDSEIQDLPYMRKKFVLICKELKISGAQLCGMCDRSPSFLSSLGDYTTTETIKVLKTSIPKLSLNWLIMDEGEMFEESDTNIIAPVDVIKMKQQLDALQEQFNNLKNMV